MSYKTGFYEGRLGIGLSSTMGMGDGNPRYPLDINGDIRLTGSIVNGDGQVLSLVPQESLWTIGTTDITYTGGNVGIGTASPGSALEIKDMTSGTAGEVESILKINSVSGYHMVSLGTAGPTSYHSGSISIYKTLSATGTIKSVHLSGSTDDTYFNGGGNVGIGTTDPGIHRLRVMGTTSAPMYGQALKVSTNGSCWLELEANAGGSVEEWGIAANSGGELSFYKRYGTGSAGYKMTLLGNGNLGIGTTSPDARLHVDVPGYGEPIAKFSGVGDAFILIEGGRTNDWDETGVVIKGMPTGGYWLAGVDDSSTYQIKYDTDFHFGNEGLGLAITTDGKVGIGTTSPSTYLVVGEDGGANATNVPGIHMKSTTSETKHYAVGQAQDRNVFLTYYANSTVANGYAALSCYGGNNPLCLQHSGGNVGIGTTSPITKLDIRRNGGARLRLENTSGGFANNNQAIEFCTHYATTGFLHQKGEALRIGVTGSVSTLRFYTGNNTGYPDQDGNTMTQSYFNETYTSSNDNPKMVIANNGRVGIGTTNPWTGLHVEASHGGNYHQAYNSWLWEANYTYTVWTADNHRPQWSDSYSYFSIYSNRAILIRNGGIWSASDKRIKMNIEDVPDHLALEMVRNIPCRYYEYKDPTRQNGNKKTIGFIAQEVDEIFPLAVTKKEDFIPSEMRLLIENENAIWSDLSDNTYKLYITDLEDAIPNTECIFMLSDCSDNVIEKKIQVLEDGKSFIFNKKWNKVFLHSKIVSDFHVVDKQKLFALNFSATQELDRKVIALENENAELKTKVSTLESQLAVINQHLGI